MCAIQIQEFLFLVTAGAAAITAAATVVLARLTRALQRATQMQFVASMTVAFQNEWHSPRATRMRGYLHSGHLHDALNKAIESAYSMQIPYADTSALLTESSLQGTTPHADRLTTFEDVLKSTSATPNLPDTTAFDALYEVLLSFDRIAVIRDVPLMIEQCISRYRPPIKALAPVLLAFIAVRRLLKADNKYKRDYIDMLVLLGKNDPKDIILESPLVEKLT
jgi:hypothetical protein